VWKKIGIAALIIVLVLFGYRLYTSRTHSGNLPALYQAPVEKKTGFMPLAVSAVARSNNGSRYVVATRGGIYLTDWHSYTRLWPQKGSCRLLTADASGNTVAGVYDCNDRWILAVVKVPETGTPTIGTLLLPNHKAVAVAVLGEYVAVFDGINMLIAKETNGRLSIVHSRAIVPSNVPVDYSLLRQTTNRFTLMVSYQGLNRVATFILKDEHWIDTLPRPGTIKPLWTIQGNVIAKIGVDGKTYPIATLPEGIATRSLTAVGGTKCAVVSSQKAPYSIVLYYKDKKWHSVHIADTGNPVWQGGYDGSCVFSLQGEDATNMYELDIASGKVFYRSSEPKANTDPSVIGRMVVPTGEYLPKGTTAGSFLTVGSGTNTMNLLYYATNGVVYRTDGQNTSTVATVGQNVEYLRPIAQDLLIGRSEIGDIVITPAGVLAFNRIVKVATAQTASHRLLVTISVTYQNKSVLHLYSIDRDGIKTVTEMPVPEKSVLSSCKSLIYITDKDGTTVFYENQGQPAYGRYKGEYYTAFSTQAGDCYLLSWKKGETTITLYPATGKSRVLFKSKAPVPMPGTFGPWYLTSTSGRRFAMLYEGNFRTFVLPKETSLINAPFGLLMLNKAQNTTVAYVCGGSTCQGHPLTGLSTGYSIGRNALLTVDGDLWHYYEFANIKQVGR